MLMNGLKWYSVINHESALTKAMILELFCGNFQVKYIKMIAWQK